MAKRQLVCKSRLGPTAIDAIVTQLQVSRGEPLPRVNQRTFVVRTLR